MAKIGVIGGREVTRRHERVVALPVGFLDVIAPLAVRQSVYENRVESFEAPVLHVLFGVWFCQLPGDPPRAVAVDEERRALAVNEVAAVGAYTQWERRLRRGGL